MTTCKMKATIVGSTALLSVAFCGYGGKILRLTFSLGEGSAEGGGGSLHNNRSLQGKILSIAAETARDSESP